MNTSVATGRATASVVDVVITPRFARALPLVVFCHSGANDATEAAGANVFTAVVTVLKRLADAGYTVVAPSAGTNTYGGPQGQTRTADAITYGRTLSGVTSAPVVLIGNSQGSTQALRYATLNPSNTACVITFNSVVSLTAAYVNDIGSTRAGIGTIYGVTYPTALPAGTDPNPVGTPLMLHHSSDELYWTTDGAGAAFLAAMGSNATEVNVGALGHTNASIAAANVHDIFNFVRAHT